MASSRNPSEPSKTTSTLPRHDFRPYDGGNDDPPHIGSTLEEFLAEEGMLAAAQATVAKRMVARQLADLMKKEKLTKDALAKRMKTSRAALDRLLDPDNPSVTLATLGKAACALKRTLRVELA